jgi:hypothetical protein
MIVLYLQADSPECFGVAEVERPQSGGADCGRTSALRVKGERGVPQWANKLAKKFILPSITVL